MILDDVSASRGALELRAQADLVDGFLGELDEDDRVAVVAFDVAARTRLGLTRVDDVDRQAVRTALAGEGGVGATDFGAALDAATALLAGVAPEDAMIVYVGDGVITSGARNLDALRARLAGKATFVGVGVGDGPDTQTLDALAAATGGYATTIDLADDVRWRAFDLVAALHTPRATGVEARLVDAAGAHVPATVYVRSAQLADGEELEVVAKLASSLAPAALELSGTVDGARWTQRVALDGARAGAGYLPRLWAQRHVAARMLAKHEPVIAPPCTDAAACPSEAELRSARDEAIRKEVVALGKRYFLLSRHTSLLVLENDAMYAKYGVAKGAGDTWAPYAVPARIAVRKVPVGPVTPATPAPTSAPDAELVRLPVPVFYPYDDLNLVFGGTAGPGWAGTGAGGGGAGFTVTREQARAEPRQRDPDAAGADTASAALDESKAERQAAEPSADVAREVAPASGPAPISPISTIPQGTSTSTGAGFGSGAGRAARIDSRWPYRYGRYGFVPTPARLAQPRDVAFDDLTGFIPALFPDASDTWRAELAAAAGGATSHPIDPAAAALLAEARRALPAGVYRWGERELAVDGARRVGWRRTTGADLGETASFDGTSWLRRYTELGIDVTRTLAEDDVAFALAHLPIWIAEPAHYARWFEVRATGPREVTLAGAAGVGFVLTFDDRHRLVSLARRGGAELVRVTWGPAGPTAAVVAGDEVEVGFTAQVVTDAVAWAHGASPAGVGVELPARQVAHWDGVLAARTPGEPAWRHAQRQRLVSLAASSDRPALVAAFEALRAHGGVELGDLVLASGGLAGVEAPLGALAGTPVGRYLAAARALHARPDARSRRRARPGSSARCGRCARSRGCSSAAARSAPRARPIGSPRSAATRSTCGWSRPRWSRVMSGIRTSRACGTRSRSARTATSRARTPRRSSRRAARGTSRPIRSRPWSPASSCARARRSWGTRCTPSTRRAAARPAGSRCGRCGAIACSRATATTTSWRCSRSRTSTRATRRPSSRARRRSPATTRRAWWRSRSSRTPAVTARSRSGSSSRSSSSAPRASCCSSPRRSRARSSARATRSRTSRPRRGSAATRRSRWRRCAPSSRTSSSSRASSRSRRPTPRRAARRSSARTAGRRTGAGSIPAIRTSTARWASCCSRSASTPRRGASCRP